MGVCAGCGFVGQTHPIDSAVARQPGEEREVCLLCLTKEAPLVRRALGLPVEGVPLLQEKDLGPCQNA